MLQVINLREKFQSLADHWHPRLVAEINDSQVKLARLEGEFVWHHHEQEDELFFVVDGALEIELRDGTLRLGPGEMVVIPRGVEHRPVARGEVLLMLIEPRGTLNTGNVRNERTVEDVERL